MLRSRGFTILERSLLGVGLALVAVWGGVMTYRPLASRAALREFEQAQAAAFQDGPTPALEPRSEGDVDFSLWSQKRVAAFHRSLSGVSASPIAVIHIEKANIRVPVFEGTDELSLNRGVGWIAGTARPGGAGNIGIAGHRDGFFRGLKDVTPGDAIELSTIRETAVYRVDQIEIVAPDNVTVLQARAVPALTLVTCYPFYFVGNAPKRYILHASLRERAANRKFKSGSGANPIIREQGDRNE
jgi:sortase A